mmetsp:Transcript_29901/g.79596  ORF Transcript_29901/g.79596 Transcript_29901/m.79596 type:complete len:104 (+) Transcript_29901:197-508(+)
MGRERQKEEESKTHTQCTTTGNPHCSDCESNKLCVGRALRAEKLLQRRRTAQHVSTSTEVDAKTTPAKKNRKNTGLSSGPALQTLLGNSSPGVPQQNTNPVAK